MPRNGLFPTGFNVEFVTRLVIAAALSDGALSFGIGDEVLPTCSEDLI